MPAGDFSASVLLSIKQKAEAMWADSRLSAEYKANADAAVAVKTNSTARFEVLTDDRSKDNKVVITWINPCAVDVQDCTSNCDLTEPEASTSSKEYTPTLCKKTGFSIDAETTRTNMYSVEEQAARLLALAIKKLDEWWAQQTLAKLHSVAGVNVAPAPWTFAAGTTTIPNNQYGAAMIPTIMYQSILNKMNNPYYINNGDLWVEWTRLMQNAGNLDGKGDAERIKALNMYWDLWNFGPAGITESLFAISSSALAFVTTNRNPDKPLVVGGQVNQTWYTVPSGVIPGVYYDVYYTLKCITGTDGKARIVHSWRVQTQGDIFTNPEGCPVTVGGNTYNPNGILGYTHGA